jgi:hypothetical protein
MNSKVDTENRGKMEDDENSIQDFNDFKVEYPEEESKPTKHPQESDTKNIPRVGRAQRLLWRNHKEEDVQHPPIRESSYSLER